MTISRQYCLMHATANLQTQMSLHGDREYICMWVAGFTVDNNLHDMLMLRCPLPPIAEWGELLRARVALLQQKGLSPQLFLPAAGLTGNIDMQAISLS